MKRELLILALQIILKSEYIIIRVDTVHALDLNYSRECWIIFLLNLDSDGVTDPLGIFPLFFKRTTDVLAPRLAVVFRRLLRLGSFPVRWRVANVFPIPKCSPSSSVANYRPITLPPILSKVLESFVSVRLGRFMECRGVLPTTQFAHRKGLGTCDAILCVAHTLQSALEMGQEARMVQIDVSAFDKVNHRGIFFTLCFVGVWGSVLSVLTQFLSNRSQFVELDGCRSKLVNLVSGVPHRNVLDPQLFLLYTAELISVVENKLYGYAHDSTLVAVVLSPAERVAGDESWSKLWISDLSRVSVWCDLWRMKLKTTSKTK